MQNFRKKTSNSFLAPTAFLVAVLLTCGQASAQKLFSYGSHPVSKDEFLKAYNKSNSDSGMASMALPEYLKLYSTFRMKVQAALDARMDTLPEQRAELKSFRLQLAESFIREDASVDLLVDEAFERSLKDIQLSQVFIPLSAVAPQVMADSITKIMTTMREVLQNKPRQLPETGQQANLGWITAFTLPYQYENIAYTTPVGKPSAPFRTPQGYHMLINEGERMASGKIRVAQILLRYHPGATENNKQALRLRADSVYKALAAGADFAELATRLSDDNLSYQTAGEIPAFGVGQYVPEFESAAFSLARDEDISKPFETSFGIHILKRLQLIPVIEDKANQEWRDVIRERVRLSDRMETAQTMLIRKIRDTIKNDAPADVLASDSSVMNYYRDHLEQYDPGFAEQFSEFRQGNLLFGIMQQKVWDPASTDTAALKRFYDGNRDKYLWEKSADAVIVTAPDTTALSTLQDMIRKNPEVWRTLSDQSNGSIQADSGRFDLGQIPVVDRTNFTKGLLTAPVRNETDRNVTFAYILTLYPEKQPKNFTEAKGAVINDYQNLLEKQWMEELNRKYPVRVNKKLFSKLQAN